MVALSGSLFGVSAGAAAPTPDAVALVLRPGDAARGWRSSDGDVATTPPQSLTPLPGEAGYVVSKAIGSLHLGRGYSLLSACNVLNSSAPPTAVLAVTNSSESSRRLPVGVSLGNRAILWAEQPRRNAAWQYDLRWYRRGKGGTVSCSMFMFWPRSVLRPPAVRLADLRYFAEVVDRRAAAAVR